MLKQAIKKLNKGVKMKKTSEQWQQEKSKIFVLDPDGWDRKNFQYSWFEELITESEYDRRVCSSTVVGINVNDIGTGDKLINNNI